MPDVKAPDASNANSSVVFGVDESGDAVALPIVGGKLDVSASVTVDTTGLATDTKQDTGNTSLAAIDAKLGARLPAALGGGGGVKIDGSGTALPVSAASLPLPSGAATESTLSAASAKLPASLGIKTAAGSLSVTHASDDAVLARTPALGQATMTNSTPVAIASDQSAVAVKGGAANQAAPSGNPIPIAGFDSGNSGRVQVPDIDSNGGLRLQSGGTSGAAVPSRVTQVGGKDSGGLLRALALSAAGVLLFAPAPGTAYSSAAAEASAVVSSSACSPARFGMLNGNAGTRYCLLFDATSLPANGAIPKDGGGSQATNSRSNITCPIPTGRYSTGLVIATSSTSSSLTIGSADALFVVDLHPSTA